MSKDNETETSEELRRIESEALALLARYGADVESVRNSMRIAQTLAVPAPGLDALHDSASHALIGKLRTELDEAATAVVYNGQAAQADADGRNADAAINPSPPRARVPVLYPAQTADSSVLDNDAVIKTPYSSVKMLFREVRPAQDCLVVLHSEDGLPYMKRYLVNEQIAIGRSASCDIRVSSDAVSRNHCLLRRDGGRLAIVDAGSTNGTLLNEQRIVRSSWIHHGDEIRIHNTVFGVLRIQHHIGRRFDDARNVVRTPRGLLTNTEARSRLAELILESSRKYGIVAMVLEQYYTLLEQAGALTCELLLSHASQSLRSAFPSASVGTATPSVLVAMVQADAFEQLQTRVDAARPLLSKGELDLGGSQCVFYSAGVGTAWYRDGETMDAFIKRAIDEAGRGSRIRVFISYGGPDEVFAARLADALETLGFCAFFFPRNSQEQIGERIFSVTRRGVTEHDYVVLLCSRASLTRPGVIAELRHTLAREEHENGGASILVPVALDEYAYGWQNSAAPELASAVRERVIGDFVGTGDDAMMFASAVENLATSLRMLHQRRQL